MKISKSFLVAIVVLTTYFFSLPVYAYICPTESVSLKSPDNFITTVSYPKLKPNLLGYQDGA